MGEFSGGDIQGKYPEHGYILTREELGEDIQTLDQVGNMVYLLVKGTNVESRTRVLQGSDYVLGVATSGVPGFFYNENPDYLVWIRNDRFAINVQNQSQPKSRRVDITVFDEGPIKGPFEIKGEEDLEGVLGSIEESGKIDLLEAKEWLRETREFLLAKLIH